MAFQVPPEVPYFVDREGEQARAFQAIEAWGGQARPLCLALSGLAGAGKTELAFRIARRLRPDHPDGVLHVDLDDLRSNGAVSVADALGELLRALGVAQEWLEVSLKARHKQYLTQTEGKRMVVIIDNARYGSEIIPLLPVSGASVVIVASQGPLTDLESGAAVELVLDPLEDRHAMELLQSIAADPRLVAEPEAAVGLIRLCSGLPAAVHVAGRLLRRQRRRSLARLLADLTVELNEKGLPLVEKVWDAAYEELSANAALLYRLLPELPGPFFTAAAAAAILGKGEDTADDALDELANAGLLDLRTERMRLPQLLHAHARRRAHHDGDESEPADGRRRIVTWYLRQAQRADARAAGERMILAGPISPVQGAPDIQFNDRVHALLWLEDERQALYECVSIAYAHGLDQMAWALCEPLWTHYLDYPHQADVVEAFQTGLAAAQRAEDLAAVVRMRCQLARPHWEQRRFQQAGQELNHALNASKALGGSTKDRKLRASVVEFRGMLHGAQGDWNQAAAAFEESLQAHREIGNDYGVLLLTYRLGQAVAELGEAERAAGLLAQAHTMAEDQQRERMTARTGFSLAAVLRTLGRTDAAYDLYLAALAGARRRESSYDEARVLDSLAVLADETGDAPAAREHRETAHRIRVRNGGTA